MVRFENVKQRLQQLLIPILLGSVAAISLIIQLSHPIHSADIWWHMLHGRQILESGSLLIDHSIFTWTPAVSYFPYTGWLGQIILYLTYEFAGGAGLMLLRYSAFFLILLLGWRYALTRGVASNPLTWTIIFIGIALTWQAPLIKTELFTIVFFTLVLWLFFHMRHKGDKAWWLAYMLPLLLVIWVNTHGAFIMASLFFAAAAVGEILNSRFCPSQAMPARLKRHFFIALALCLPAIFITPFGYDFPLTIISDILSNRGFHGRVSGYVPTFLFNIAPYYLLDYMLVAMLLFVLLLWQKLRNRQTDWVVILVFLGYSAIFTQLARVTFFLGPVFIFTSLDLLAEKENSWAWSPSKIINTLLIALCVSVTATIGWRTLDFNYCRLFGYKGSIQQAFSSSSEFPKDETEYIKKNLAGTRIGNMYRDGGYLEYHLWPKKKVMIDTRYFPFRAWINDYFSFVDGNDIDNFVKNYPADYWLINYKLSIPLSWFSQSDKWKPAFLGPTGVVFVPAETAPEKPEMVSNLGSKIGIGDYSYAFRAAIQLQDIAFAKRIFTAAQKINGPSCYGHTVLARDMGDTIAGLQAYMGGNYEEAAKLLSKKHRYILTQGKAADALMKLAERSWNQGDIAGARNWYAKIFKLLNNVNITDIYNLAILDWQYRFSNAKNFVQPADDFHWQRLVAYILQREDEILQPYPFILETAKAMKEGRYDGTASLVPRHKEYKDKKQLTK